MKEPREVVIPTDPDADVGATVVAAILGVTTMSVWRYYSDERYAHLNFPEPRELCGRARWRVGDIRQWRDSLPLMRRGRTRVGAAAHEAATAA